MIESIETNDQELLRTELREAREQLDRLVGDLRTVDGELDGLGTERQQYGLLQEACASLEALDEIGAADLFWSGRDSGSNGPEHLRLVRGRVDQFEKRLREIEDRRQDLLDEIQLKEDNADFIAGDVLEAERLAELKKLEWEIERDVESIPIRASIMPWATGGDDDRRFRKALAISLFISLLFGVLLPFIDLPLPEHWELLEEQNRLTQLIREERAAVPPVVIPESKPVIPDEPVPTNDTQSPQIAEETTPTAEPSPAAKPQDTASRGILAFREEFSALTQNNAVDRLGANANIDDAGTTASGLPQRSMVTTQAPGSSGGINIAKLSRGTGGTGAGMGGVAVTQATSTIGSGGGGDRPLAGGGPGLSRTDEEIQIVFDRHKAALYRIYNRALRMDPTLKGQIVLRLTIEPDGSVSLCKLKSTNMKAPNLANQVVERVKTFDFGAKEGIPAVTIVYPIDFLPAT
jgi:outer membrane biosynthesis protein TonB